MFKHYFYFCTANDYNPNICIKICTKTLTTTKQLWFLKKSNYICVQTNALTIKEVKINEVFIITMMGKHQQNYTSDYICHVWQWKAICMQHVVSLAEHRTRKQFASDLMIFQKRAVPYSRHILTSSGYERNLYDYRNSGRKRRLVKCL